MRAEDIFKEIEQDYGVNIALLTVQLYSIARAIKRAKYSRFKAIEKFDRVAWEESQEAKDLAVKCWDALYDYEISHACEGLGGCVAKSIKQIVEEMENGD